MLRASNPQSKVRVLVVLLGLAAVVTLVVALTLRNRVEVTINMDWTADDACPHTVVIGAAGSGQRDDDSGAGPQVDSVVSAFSAQVVERATSSISVGFMALDYPAPGFLEGTLFGFLGDNMFDSIAQGRETVLSVIAATSERCPTASFYLVGYSQGASVVHTAVSDMPAADRDSIAGVVVLSDPNRDADDPHTEHHTTELQPAMDESATPHTRDGVLGGLSTPTWLAGPFHSACARMDAVCNFSLIDVIVVDTVHTDETYHGLGPHLGRLLADDLLRQM